MSDGGDARGWTRCACACPPLVRGNLSLALSRPRACAPLRQGEAGQLARGVWSEGAMVGQRILNLSENLVSLILACATKRRYEPTNLRGSGSRGYEVREPEITRVRRYGVPGVRAYGSTRVRLCLPRWCRSHRPPLVAVGG